MKIQPKHLEYVKAAIDEVLKRYPNVVDEYEKGLFPRSDKVKDLQKRFCFDLAYSAGLQGFAAKVLYTYMNDDHFYTALKSICPKVTRKY